MALISTSVQRGELRLGLARNRFNGFGQARETVETVSSARAAAGTPLKRGVNERASHLPQSAGESGAGKLAAYIRLLEGVAQIFNLLYRRFAIGNALPRFQRPAGFKPAIQQIENLRYDSCRPNALRTPRSALRACLAFTLLELLVVIGIIGLLAGLAVPILNNFKPNYSANATRALMDDLSRARQLAISEHTTVLMVFVKTNFWVSSIDKAVQSWQPADWVRATNLVNKQLVGYTFVSVRSLGDQPGVHTPQYLAGWKTLPDGAFLTLLKFTLPSGGAVPFTIYTNDLSGNPVPAFPLYGFNYTAQVPFPRLETPIFSPKQPYVLLPYIAFNYLGQRCDDNGNVLQQNAVFPLAKGNISFARDEATHTPKFAPPTLFEQPSGNATNPVSYNLVSVDWLTGRARAIQQEVR
ncbi:MAG TPA: prepilin-type N-terminal cleavage/methylation domain-containing protein [Candidatus Acidoferrum sp.]|jgi:prepilin-type N-terminal cleavage/methylation domain-containing protein|nr:prepilin-type N-terminal cleavage/methylation domain-containing protein [Candidatus Acidoferrum sp.]